jgi:hypothetical protein
LRYQGGSAELLKHPAATEDSATRCFVGHEDAVAALAGSASTTLRNVSQLYYFLRNKLLDNSSK